MKTIMVTGVKGVGKSKIVSAVANELKLQNADYADYMLKTMQSNDKDIIELLLSDERMEIVRKTRDFIEKQFILDTNNDIILLENHLTTVQNLQIDIPELDIYWRFNILCIIVIYADPEQIFERRKLDINRNRQEESKTLIDAQQEENALQAKLISSNLNVPLKFFYNDNNHLPTEEICEWIRSQIN